MNKVTKFARILNLNFLDYPPCTCKIPGQDHFWALNFYLLTDFQFFCGTFYDFWNANGWQYHIYMRVF